MDEMIKKQEITIKNLQLERKLSKISKTSPNIENYDSNNSPQFGDSYQDSNQNQQNSNIEQEYVSFGSTKPRTKWEEKYQP